MRVIAAWSTELAITWLTVLTYISHVRLGYGSHLSVAHGVVVLVSFTKQVLAQLDFLKYWKETIACKTDGYLLPKQLGRSCLIVARLHIPVLGAVAIVLTQEQALSTGSTEVSGVPAEAVPAKISVKNCRTSLRVLLRLWCPLRPQPWIHCLQPARRSITCFCFAWRLPCAATELDGLREGTTVIEP